MEAKRIPVPLFGPNGGPFLRGKKGRRRPVAMCAVWAASPRIPADDRRKQWAFAPLLWADVMAGNIRREELASTVYNMSSLWSERICFQTLRSLILECDTG